MATLDLNGSNITLPDGGFFNGAPYLNGTDNVTNNGGAIATLTEGGGPNGTIYSGTITDGSHATAITQTSGYVNFTAANTYGGGTNLLSGTIGVSNGQALGTGLLTMSNGTTLQDTNSSIIVQLFNNVLLNGTDTIDYSVGGAIASFGISGIISGTGSLNLIGGVGGELTLTNANTYSGGTNLLSGALSVFNGAALGTGTLSMANGTLLDPHVPGLTVANNISLGTGFAGIDDSDNGTNLTLSGIISGPGGLGMFADHGPATVQLSGANTYSGLTALDSGLTLNVRNNTALGTGLLYMPSGSILQAGAPGLSLGNRVSLTSGAHTIDTNGVTFTLTGVINDYAQGSPGALTKVGAGTLKLSNAETYSGGTTLSAGSLELGSGGSIAGNVTFAGVNTTLRLDASVSQLGGQIAGMVASDAIDLGFIPFASGEHAVWQQNGNGGLLSLVNGNGTTLASFNLLGQYTTASFTAMSDNNNGSLIVLPTPPTPPPPLPNTRDIFWHDASGANLVWALNQNEQIIGGPNLPTVPTSWAVAGVGDFNNDGISDLLWRDASGANQIWNLNSSELIGNGANLPTVPSSWSFAGIGNFLGNGLSDVVWHNANGQNLIWNIQNDQLVNGASLPATAGAWSLAGVGNFLGNGFKDLIWHNTQTGQNLIWNLQGDALVNGATLPTTPTSWTVAGIGAFGGNGQSNILWHNASGQNLIWIIQNDQLVGGINLPSTPTSWNVAGIGDFTGSGTDDILWHDASGANQIWNMQNFQVVGGVNLPTTPTSWNIAGVGINSITSGLSAGHNGDPALSQMIQAMASFSPSGAHGASNPITQQASDTNSQMFGSNPVLGYTH